MHATALSSAGAPTPHSESRRPRKYLLSATTTTRFASAAVSAASADSPDLLAAADEPVHGLLRDQGELDPRPGECVQSVRGAVERAALGERLRVLGAPVHEQ